MMTWTFTERTEEPVRIFVREWLLCPDGTLGPCIPHGLRMGEFLYAQDGDLETLWIALSVPQRLERSGT